MSGKSNNPGSIISLPQGGGALHGLGETFSPDLQTGTGNFSIPISIPPGRNGFQPQLTLQYSTGNPNGPFGHGWGISVPGVARKISSRIPIFDDNSDTFVLSGHEDLVAVPGAPTGAQRYRPRAEGLFARIDHYRDLQNNYWDVRTKDGLRNTYGTPRPANAGPDWIDPAVLADPRDLTHVFAWKLTQTIDPFGNRIEYAYERASIAVDGPHKWDQIYLSEIRYCDYGDPNNPEFLVSITFTYEDRPDHFSSYRSGFEIRTVRRCTSIKVTTNPGVLTPVRTYHLSYLDEQGLPKSELPMDGFSLLNKIQVEGHDGNASEWLPPLEFNYTQFQPKQRHFSAVTGPEMPVTSIADPSCELVDLLGNGLPAILEMNGVTRYWRNVGNGHFAVPQYMERAPAGAKLADVGVRLLDANGDGRVDLLVTKPSISGYYSMRFEGLWDEGSFHRYSIAPSFNLEDPEVRLVDLDGDGVTDALRSDTRFDCFFNNPETGWGKTRRVERKALDEFPNVNFSDPRVKWADFSGDGLQDIALVHDGNVDYWPNLGYGNWGKRIHMRNSPRFPYGYNPKRILVGDVDGDGLADIVYVDDRRITLWINICGNAWTDPIVIEGTPPVADTDAVRLADLNGAGTAGVLWSANATGLPGQRMFFLDLTGGTKPYLLTEMNNHIGSLTRVQYSSSTRFYLEDQQRLATQWKTPLPFPVQVVARVESIDQISGGKLTTEYSYHHGYWDGADREFRGFGRVDQRDTEVFTDYHSSGLHDLSFTPVDPIHFSPPTETRTWFHLGPVGDEFGGWYEADFSSEFWKGDPDVLSRPPSVEAFLASLPRRVKRDALRALRGQIIRSELYALDGSFRQDRPYTVTEHLAGVREESPPTPTEGDRRHIFFPFHIANRTTQWERGCDPMTQFTFSGNYDAYGQPLQQCSVAVPRGRDFRVSAPPNEPYLATVSFTTYAARDDAQRYCVNRVARSTSFEILNDGSPSVFALASAALAGISPTRIIGQTYTYYDGSAFQGLPFGVLGDYGAPVRTETLVLTKGILHRGYRSGDTILNPPEEPPYFATTGSPPWNSDYSAEFQTTLAPLAGYIFHQGGPGKLDAEGYFTSSAQKYDFQQVGVARGLRVVERDAFGHDTFVAYDSYQILPILVTDPANLTTSAIYDYRVMKPQEVTDPNGNMNSFTFTPLGLLVASWVKGKAGEGDQQSPSVSREYDVLAFETSQQPISVRTVRRIYHDTQIDVPLPQRHETIERVEYSDGFGRLLQTRAQAEDVIFGDPVFGSGVLSSDQGAPPRDAIGVAAPLGSGPWVRVSGWEVHNNKGRVVMKYEPFFSAGWDYESPSGLQLGQRVTMFYDPRAQLTRTVNPDGSEQLVVHGVPGDRTTPDLKNPAVFEPTAWEAYTYDSNDNAGRTHPIASLSYQSHWNTPSSIVVDALSRTVQAVVRNGPSPASDWYTTTSTYDIHGNLLSVTDAQNRLAFRYDYDLVKHPLRVENIDAGIRRTITDANGNPVEARSANGALQLRVYDILNRQVRLWARDGAGQALTLREKSIYGDGPDSELTRVQAVDLNLLGKPYKQYDEAGLLTIGKCDFKGNIQEKIRQVISDGLVLSSFNQPPVNWQLQAFRVDWQPPSNQSFDDYADATLDPTVYQISSAYDALNRIQSLLYPQDLNGYRRMLLPRYNKAGSLEHLDLDGTTYVDYVAYNAKGQRSLIAYGNGVMTRYAYDSQAFRLVRLCSEPYTAMALSYHANGAALQDFAYAYDLAGNLLNLKDRTPGSGVPNTILGLNGLDRYFAYDPIYRLVNATGRECDVPPPPPPWDDLPRCADVTLARPYTESYSYDSIGNLVSLSHSTGATRIFDLAVGTNRLASLKIGQQNIQYAYDANGNFIQETSSRNFEWDHSDRLRVFRIQPSNAEPSIYGQYLYDAGGRRVKKVVRKQGGQIQDTVYIDGLFEFQSISHGAIATQNNLLHVMDAQARIAMLRIGIPFKNDSTPAVKYQLCDHLESSNVIVDSGGALINCEEYTPYGDTSFGSFSQKRYRFSGKERDEESALYYFGARYLAPYLGRWISVDPARFLSFSNPYTYASDSPLSRVDPQGSTDEPVANTSNPEDPLNYPDFESYAAQQPTPLTTESKRATWDAAHASQSTSGSTAALGSGVIKGSIQATVELFQPTSPNGTPLRGQLQLYSKNDFGNAARAAAEASCASGENHMIKDTAYYAAAEAEELKLRRQLGIPVGDLPQDRYNKIWVVPSRGAVIDATLSLHGVNTQNDWTLSDPSAPLFLPPNTIQAGTEKPWLRVLGPGMGAMTMGAGALDLYSAASSDTPDVLRPPLAVGAALQFSGGLAYGVGAWWGDGAMMAAGGTVAEIGMAISMPATLTIGVAVAAKEQEETRKLIQPKINQLYDEGNWLGAGMLGASYAPQ